MTGRVYGLGLGPGDPELLTLKALRLIRACPVIAWPAPLEGDSLARRIVAEHLAGKEEIAIRMPLEAARFPAQAVYDQAALAIGRVLDGGRDVAVLCQGDPFLYGSFMYLFARLAGRYPVEVVPGVSSLTACAAALGRPLVSREQVLTVIPATLPEAVIAQRLAETDAAMILKLGRNFPKVRRVLDGLGLEARYVAHATWADQEVLPLDRVAPDRVPYFSAILAWRPAEEPG